MNKSKIFLTASMLVALASQSDASMRCHTRGTVNGQDKITTYVQVMDRVQLKEYAQYVTEEGVTGRLFSFGGFFCDETTGQIDPPTEFDSRTMICTTVRDDGSEKVVYQTKKVAKLRVKSNAEMFWSDSSNVEFQTFGLGQFSCSAVKNSQISED